LSSNKSENSIQRAIRTAFLLLLLFASAVSALAQNNPYGERINPRDGDGISVAEGQEKIPSVATDNKTCEKCGKPTFLNYSRCLDCLRLSIRGNLTDLMDAAMQRSKDALQKLRDPNLKDEIIESLLKAKREFQDQKGKDSDYERNRRRREIENLGKVKIGSNNQEINELAREVVMKYLPALEGTDYAVDPIKTLSYFLILDGKGFIEEVRCLRGPFGQPMTLLEAYQYYTRTDPKKANDILEIINDVRKLSDPQCDGEEIPAVLDAVARGIKILSE